MVAVFVGAFRKWHELLHVKKTLTDEFGDKVLTVVPK